MTNIRRYFRPGDISFLTHVTHNRQAILVDNFDKLWESIESIKEQNPFELIAWAVLPDHFHLLIDPMENDLSKLMKRIKLSFSAKYRKLYGSKSGRVWQNRFWDHIIRDDNDLQTHFDYIHYNSVKHGMTYDPSDWKFSSIHKYIEEGIYERGWGEKNQIKFEGEFGE